MIGMPGTGKTTMIAAIYHVVESGQVEDSLQLVDLGENREYLVQLLSRWLDCLPLDRTKIGEEQVVTMKLQDASTGNVTELALPDVSGETFRDHWEQRKSTKVFDDLARQSDGALFLVHPDTVHEAVRINLRKDVAYVLEDDEDRDDSSTDRTLSETQNESAAEWSPRSTPTQVQLVDVLQIMLREPHIYPLSRVAVIVSAWDSVKDDYKLPSAWLAKRLPMLDQFIKANSDRISFKVFGVSAQGAALDKDNTALLAVSPQAKRIEVVTDVIDEYNKHDITAPIKWLMETKE